MKNQEELDKLTDLLPYSIAYTKIKEKSFQKDFLKYVSAKHSLIPDFVTVIPFNSLLKFLYVFEGKKVLIPNKKLILNAIRNLDIYYSLKKRPTKKEADKILKKYSITPQMLQHILSDISDKLEKDKLELN